jgi:molybdenum cofactor cytidylyltransferase
VSASNVVGILLAAGRGARFGRDKRLAIVDAGPDAGSPMAVASCRRLRAAGVEVVAVVRVGDQELKRRLQQAGAQAIECAAADDGMGATLACGVAATGGAGGWIVALADMPWIEPDTIARVADALRGGASIAAPFHRGRRGHPVGFSAEHRDALLALTGDEGARRIVAANEASLVPIAVDDEGVLRDVDHPHDLS